MREGEQRVLYVIPALQYYSTFFSSLTVLPGVDAANSGRSGPARVRHAEGVSLALRGGGDGLVASGIDDSALSFLLGDCQGAGGGAGDDKVHQIQSQLQNRKTYFLGNWFTFCTHCTWQILLLQGQMVALQPPPITFSLVK